MFNLPWYSWLNVLGLVLLWAFMYVDYVALKKPQWVHRLTTASLVASAFTIVLYWNPGFNTLFNPLQYGLIALILPLAVWLMGLGITELALAIVSYCFASKNRRSVMMSSSEPVSQFNLDDDEIDLDAGESPSHCHSEMVGASISNLFSSDASARSNIESIIALTGVDVDELNNDTDISLHLVHTLMVSMLLVPPMIMSLRLV